MGTFGTTRRRTPRRHNRSPTPTRTPSQYLGTHHQHHQAIFPAATHPTADSRSLRHSSLRTGPTRHTPSTSATGTPQPTVGMPLPPLDVPRRCPGILRELSQPTPRRSHPHRSPTSSTPPRATIHVTFLALPARPYTAYRTPDIPPGATTPTATINVIPNTHWSYASITSDESIQPPYTIADPTNSSPPHSDPPTWSPH